MVKKLSDNIRENYIYKDRAYALTYALNNVNTVFYIPSNPRINSGHFPDFPQHHSS